jgi:hypothetical protein
MKENTMDLDTLLRETRDVPDASPAVLSAARAGLDASTDAAALRVAATRRALDRRRRRRVVLSALVGVAASAALVLAPTLDLLGRGPGGTASATETLLRAAGAAGDQQDGWADAPYWHTVSEYQDPGRGSTVYRRESWQSRDGVGILVDQGVKDGETIGLGPAAFPAGEKFLTWDELDALPTDPVVLDEQLRAGIGETHDEDDALFVMVGDLLRESPASPELRRALWEVAARIPGITLVGDVTDAAGRPGVAVARGIQQYVLDPDDGQLLEETYDLGESLYRGTLLEQGPAETAPATPPLPEGCTSYVVC